MYKRMVFAAAVVMSMSGCASVTATSEGSEEYEAIGEGLYQAMYDCVDESMAEAAGSSAVDSASVDALGTAMQVFLQACGDQAMADANLPVDCDGDGSYRDSNGKGHHWTSVAVDWVEDCPTFGVSAC